MNRVPGALRPVLLLLLPLTGFLFPSGANPLPDSAIFTHVQSPNAAFCDQVSTLPCEQIVQWTEAAGRLEFDVFLYPFFYVGERVEELHFTATWPASWSFVEASLCNGAEGSISVEGNRATVSASWPDCPTMNSEAFLVARVVLDVTERGEFAYRYDMDYGITWGCDELPPTWVGALEGAEAGVECDYCYTPCDFQVLCHPVLSPATLDVEPPQGVSDPYVIHAIVYFGEQTCAPAFSGTESWMNLMVEQIDYQNYDLLLTIDAEGLAPGEYSGWVIGQGDCRGCTRVNLTVSHSQGIEEPAEDPVPPGEAKTWGQIKTLYR